MTQVGRLSMRLQTYSRRFFSSARHDGPIRAHFDGRKFRNEVPTKNWSGHVLKWFLRRDAAAWPRWIEGTTLTADALPAERVGLDEVKLTFVNHATVLIQACGLNFLTDPVWSHRVGPFPWLGPARVREPGLTLAQLPPIDVILLSHDHYDHLDVATVRQLLARDRPRLLCGLGVERTLAIEGLPGAEALDWWQTCQLGHDVKVTFTPSRHFSGRGLYDQDSTLWGSFVVSTPLGPLYFAGDTGYGPHFAAVAKRFGPMACALLPIGCYEPRWFMEPFHMSPIDAVQAHCDLGSRFSIGIHHGTFRLGDESYEQPGIDLAAELRRRGLAADAFVVPGFGQCLPLPSKAAAAARRMV
jgi:L-ascorbate metabolism protein UlaG (beta-lactamase superfamily)